MVANPSINPILAPRKRSCRVCELVAMPEDVTIRLYSPELDWLPLEGAIEYLQAVGLTGTSRQLSALALTHRRHVDKFIAGDGAVAPAERPGGRLPAPIGRTTWVDVNQSGMNIGQTAASILAERMESPSEVETKDLISIANLGQSAASKRADMEMKGQLRRAEALAQIASGFRKPEEATG